MTDVDHIWPYTQYDLHKIFPHAVDKYATQFNTQLRGRVSHISLGDISVGVYSTWTLLSNMCD